MSTYRVPKCGRLFVKFDDVTIYPVWLWPGLAVINNKQLLDGVEHDIMNYKNRSLTRGFDNS